MEKRFLSNGSTLTEVWCAGVPGSDNVWSTLTVCDIVEKTDIYEIYNCVEIDNATGIDADIKIKVYLDKEVLAGGNFHLGESSDRTVDGKGGAIPKAIVYEIIERDGGISGTETSNEGEPEFTQMVDEETGLVYDVDKNNYVWEDGEKTNMWFTSDGKFVNPNAVIVDVDAHAEDDDKLKGFAAVAGMDDLKAEMLDEVKFVIDNPDKAKKFGLHLPNGMLLYGYPGCGKTFFAQKLAEELNVKFLYKHGSEIGSHYMHRTEQNIGKLFEEAKKMAPCIICIDEIDGFLPYRRNGEDVSCALVNSEVNEFLSQMNNCGKDNVMVIGTTNNPSLLDPALLRTGRMDKLVYVPLPDEKAREEMIRLKLKDLPHDENMDFSSVSQACDGMVMSDIEFMIHSVVLRCAREDNDITEEVLTEAALTSRRSISIPKNEEQKPAPVVLKPADTRIKGFSIAV